MKSRILIVDDEEPIRHSLAEILGLEGYDAVTAESGEAAVRLLQKESFDMVLLDLKMPDMAGLDVLRFIHSLTPDTEVILLTAHGSLESAIEALREGAHDYILKPANTHSILDSIERALAHRVEALRRRQLLDQLDRSIQSLKDAEGMEKKEVQERGVILLENGVVYEIARREIWKGNQSVSLTPTEGRLMKVFLEHQGTVLTHTELVQLVQGYEPKEWEAAEVLRPIVSRLRRKLAVFPGGERWIVNVRSTGYVFEPQ